MLKKKITNLLFKIEKFYDIYVCEKSFYKVEQLAVILAMFFFIVHIGFIFLNNTFETGAFISSAGTNYFGAIFTPFGIILFYEVFSLILSIARDIASSLTRQYQIVSLIILLRVFKDVSQAENINSLTLDSEILRNILIDLGGALILFALIGIFNFSIKYKEDSGGEMLYNNLKVYKASKKVITLGLLVALAILALSTLTIWIGGLFEGNYVGIFTIQAEFFQTLFVMLVFTDIVLVLLSYFFANTYAVIFMNATFIISTIFIRFALSSERPTDIALAGIAIVIGIAINILYGIFTKKLAVFKYAYEL